MRHFDFEFILGPPLGESCGVSDHQKKKPLEEVSSIIKDLL